MKIEEETLMKKAAIFVTGLVLSTGLVSCKTAVYSLAEGDSPGEMVGLAKKQSSNEAVAVKCQVQSDDSLKCKTLGIKLKGFNVSKFR